jgi:hypothetical protein
VHITEANRIHLAHFGMQTSTAVPYLAAINRTLISVNGKRSSSTDMRRILDAPPPKPNSGSASRHTARAVARLIVHPVGTNDLQDIVLQAELRPQAIQVHALHALVEVAHLSDSATMPPLVRARATTASADTVRVDRQLATWTDRLLMWCKEIDRQARPTWTDRLRMWPSGSNSSLPSAWCSTLLSQMSGL